MTIQIEIEQQYKTENSKKNSNLPNASICLFEDPGGLPRCFFPEASEDGVVPPDSPWPPLPTAAEEGIGVGDNPSAMLPSGEYFLGRPLFFLFPESMLKPPPLPPTLALSPGGEDPSYGLTLRDSNGFDADCGGGGGGVTELNGNLAPPPPPNI